MYFWFRELIVVVKKATLGREPVENINTSDLRPYKKVSNSDDPYITTNMTAGALPLTLVIGDGKKYNYQGGTYTNKALEPNTSYIVFLRFFEAEVKPFKRISLHVFYELKMYISKFFLI